MGRRSGRPSVGLCGAPGYPHGQSGPWGRAGATWGLWAPGIAKEGNDMNMMSALYGKLHGEKANPETKECLRTIREMLSIMVHYHDADTCEMPDNCGHCVAVRRALECLQADADNGKVTI